jgi:glutamine amidotransferase-like uncharacterized protein
MKSRTLTLFALLVLLWVLMACGEKGTPTANATSTAAEQARLATPTLLSITATAVAGITLVPHTRAGFSGVVPDGWTEKNSGEFWRGAPETDPTLLLQQAVPGATTDLVIQLLAPKLGLEKFPERVGLFKNQHLSWDLYAIEREEPDVGTMAGDIALAQDDHGVYLVLLGAKPDEYEDLHYGVFLRAVDAFTPVAAEETAQDAGQPQQGVGTVGAEVLLVKGEKLENDASDTVARIIRAGFGLSTAFVDLDALGEVDFEGVKLIFFPGGECGAVRLSDKASRRVREAVAAGTGYIGTCCGAFLAAEGVTAASHLRLQGDAFGVFPGLAEWGGGEGTWPFYIDVDHPIVANSTMAEGISPVMRLKFVGGTSNLLPSYADGLANWRVATLDDPTAGGPGGERAAMTATVFGTGRVFLSGAHPEAQATSHPLMLAAVEWCTRASDPATDRSPVIVADVPAQGVANRFFIVSAAGSHDPHRYPVGFIWDFGDGSPKQYRPEAIHIYEKPGTYTLTLTVTTGTRHSTRSTAVTIGEP